MKWLDNARELHKSSITEQTMVVPRDSLKDKGPSLYQALRRASQFVKLSRAADDAFWRTVMADSVDNGKGLGNPADSSLANHSSCGRSTLARPRNLQRRVRSYTSREKIGEDSFLSK